MSGVLSSPLLVRVIKCDDGVLVRERVFVTSDRDVFKYDGLGHEIMGVALPASLALTADPIASLVDTAFIGQIGPVELAAVGVAIALFNQVSRIAIFPLVSITTSFVAEEDAVCCTTLESQESDDCSGVCLAANHEEKEMMIRKGKSFSLC